MMAVRKVLMMVGCWVDGKAASMVVHSVALEVVRSVGPMAGLLASSRAAMRALMMVGCWVVV